MGPREGGYGRHKPGDRPERRGAAGAVVRTGADVAAIDAAGGRTRGVTLDSGEQLSAPLVVSGAHPRTTVLDMVGASTSRTRW